MGVHFPRPGPRLLPDEREAFLNPAGAALVALLGLAIAVSLVFATWRICGDVRRIREHLDRVVPDYIRDRKARVREKLAGDEEPAKLP